MTTRRRRRSPFFWARAALLTVGALALAWVIISSSIARALPPHVLESLGISDRSPQAQFRAAAQLLVSNRGQLSAGDYAALIGAANAAPLASEPFAYAGFRALAAQDLGLAERLFVEARRRNPRLALARLALISIYVQTNRPGPAGQEIAATTRVVPQSATILIDELVRVAQNPAARPALVTAIGSDPIMAEILNRLASANADPGIIIELAARQPAGTGGRFAPWQSRLVEMLVDRGDVRRARQVWASFAGAPGGTGGTIYDPEFRGLPGGPPFNWQLLANEVGSAERSQAGGLEIDFFGRRTGPLASQLLTLQPGSYLLSLRAEGSANGEGAQLVWRIACRGGSQLGELPLVGITYSPRELTREFVVPGGGCPTQTIELVGVAGEFPAQQTARITGISLRSAGAAR